MEHEIFDTLEEDRIPSETQILDFYNSFYSDDEIPGAKEVLSVRAYRPVNPKTQKEFRAIECRILREDGGVADLRFNCLENSIITEERNIIL